jgi:cell division protein FtsB
MRRLRERLFGMKIIAIIISLASLILLAGCASQDDVLTLDYRLSVLEQRNRELAKQTAELDKMKAEITELNTLLNSQMDNFGKTLGAEDQKNTRAIRPDECPCKNVWRGSSKLAR